MSVDTQEQDKLHYFIQKPWTKELVDEESYERWRKKNPEYKASYKKYLEYWDILVDEIIDVITHDTNGFEFPLYLGVLSVKKIDLEVKCEKDFPTKISYNKEGELEKKIIPNMSNTCCKIYWKKNRRYRSVPNLLALEANSVLRKKVVKKIRGGESNVYQMARQTKPIASKCEPFIEKNLFDLL